MLILSTPLLQITQWQVLNLSCPLLLHRSLALMEAHNEYLLMMLVLESLTEETSSSFRVVGSSSVRPGACRQTAHNCNYHIRGVNIDIH